MKELFDTYTLMIRFKDEKAKREAKNQIRMISES